MVGLDDLRKVLHSERETGRLTQIPQDLFERGRTALAARREKVQVIDDPFSDKAQALIDETKSIEQTLHDLFVARSEKILDFARVQAGGNYFDREEIKRMIPGEREMFERITGAISACQGALFTTTRQSLPMQHDSPFTVSQDQPLPHEVTAAPSSPPPSPPYSVVRVLADMDAFMGIDGKTYELSMGDIVTLPERNAEVLVERNIALNMNLSK